MNQQNQLQTTIPIYLVRYGDRRRTISFVNQWTHLGLEKSHELVKSVPVKFDCFITSNQTLEFCNKFRELQDKGVEIYLDQNFDIGTLKLNDLLDKVNDETTSIKRLTQIFLFYFLNLDLNRDKILKAIAFNPNTPFELLEILGKYYPDEFLDNPALDLYIIANPNLLAEISEDTLISLLKSDRVPESFILFALNSCQSTRIYKSILTTHRDVWNQWRKNNPKVDVDLKEVNLARADLNGFNLSGINLYHANLRTANLRGANLKGTNLENANLRGANLKGTNLENANLRGANLRGTNLRGANLKGANLKNTCLKNTKLNQNSQIDSKWQLVWNIVNNRKSKKNLTNIDLESANLKDADLVAANLKNTNLKNVNLSDADLKDTDFSNADLTYANLENADLTYANLENANLRRANLKGANLENANLKDANLTSTNLSDANLKNSKQLNQNKKSIRNGY